ncbi:PKD domain-containing protein [Galbitalea sp. SE-J8]|uniref:PKD domain-containing protein n=1 Tax=Galbitalea sp. SE-J8 TaxID=3054952 RepID=UPI00259CF613|nr:PKD domain-containing protein [Galbitalea sp. SE-J8]MDM4762869.1 PKD domain-containing protein [Galbitalea sp. SE-J8]
MTGDVVVSFAEVQAGGLSASYELRSVAGGTTSSDQFAGISVRSLVQDVVGIPAGSVSFAEVTVASTGPMTLSSADLGDPADAGYPFPSGLLPAFYVAGSDALGYVRPLRDDDQPNDLAQTSANGVVDLTLHTSGSLLAPTLSADRDSVDAGGTVTFTTSGVTASGLDYAWDFGDGAPVAGDAVASHAYSTPGRYAARVIVRGADGSLGVSGRVFVTVGEPAVLPSAPPSVPAGGESTTPAAPTTGPADGAGQDVGGRTHDRSTGHAHDGHRDDSGTTGPSDATTAPSRTPEATAEPSPPPAEPSPIPSPADTPGSTAGSSQREISGVLISAPGGPEPTASADGALQATAPEQRAGGGSLGWGAVGGAVTVALLAIGVLGESGMLRRLRPRRTGAIR